MDLKDSHFKYSATIKNDQNIEISALSLFPKMHEISLQSRTFQTYSEAVKSCKGLMEDLMRDINLGFKEDRFKVAAEVNPKYSGTQTLSKDWDDVEVARFWVYNKAMEGKGQISAVGKSSIVGIPKLPSEFILN